MARKIDTEDALRMLKKMGGGGGGIAEETDPTVPSWAKQPKKPTYTAEEVGALPNTTKIPSKTSDLTNDSGFITGIPNEYVTETELAAKGYLTSVPSQYVTDSELSAKKYLTSVPDEYITETELNAKGYLTQHQDLSSYAKKTEVPTKVSQLTNDSGYLTAIPSEYVTETELTAKKYLTSVPSEYVTDTELTAKGYATQSSVSQLSEEILDLKENGTGGGAFYGVCSTAADTVAKTVTVEGNFTLKEGAMVAVKFTNANSIASPTLNVNGTGDIPIYRYGTTTASTSTTVSGWVAGAVQVFVYDGAGWIRDYWSNTTYTNVALGQGYATCSTAETTKAKVGTLSSYALTTGGIVAVKFTNAVPASSTLNVNSKGAKSIYYRGSAITDGVIKAGDIATFIYSSQYHLISIDRWQNDIDGLAEEIANKQPKGDYLTSVPSEYVTETELNAKGYAKQTDVTNLSNEIDNKVDSTEIFELTKIAKFTNVFDTVGIEYGKIMNSAGVISDTTANLCVTDFIPIVAGQTVYMEEFAGYVNSTQVSPCVVVFNSAKEVVNDGRFSSFPNMSYFFSDLVYNEAGHIVSFKILRPATTAYIRICTNTTVVGKNPILTINEPIEYEMEYAEKLNSKFKVDYSQILNTPQRNCWDILPNEHLNIAYSQVNKDGKPVKPINTLEHFIHISENYGYNALKCDVRPTSDGELVLCHDAGFTFNANGYITTYDSNNQTKIHDVTASTCLGYSFATGEHPCLIGDYLKVCRKYGKVAFITIRNEYMDVVIPKVIEELKNHNMTHSAIINCMTYESLVQWRTYDKDVMINYTLAYGVNIDQDAIDKAINLGYCSINGFGLSSASTTPSTTCDFEYCKLLHTKMEQ